MAIENQVPGTGNLVEAADQFVDRNENGSGDVVLRVLFGLPDVHQQVL
jgi:hypothetical protein